jgi:hypothetical protein
MMIIVGTFGRTSTTTAIMTGTSGWCLRHRLFRRRCRGGFALLHGAETAS